METSTRTLNKSFLERIDWRLITIILILFGTSCLIINSAMSGGQYETNFLLKQVLYYVLGFILAIALMFISPKTLRKICLDYIHNWKLIVSWTINPA